MAGDAAEDSGKKDEKSGNQEDDEAGAGHCRWKFLWCDLPSGARRAEELPEMKCADVSGSLCVTARDTMIKRRQRSPWSVWYSHFENAEFLLSYHEMDKLEEETLFFVFSYNNHITYKQ